MRDRFFNFSDKGLIILLCNSFLEKRFRGKAYIRRPLKSYVTYSDLFFSLCQERLRFWKLAVTFTVFAKTINAALLSLNCDLWEFSVFFFKLLLAM